MRTASFKFTVHMKVILETDRLVLREYVKEDAESVAFWGSQFSKYVINRDEWERFPIVA